MKTNINFPKILLVLTISWALLSCTSADRGPASVASDSEAAQKIQRLDMEMSQLWNQNWGIDQEILRDPKPTLNEQSRLTQLQQRIQNAKTERQALIKDLSAKVDFRAWSGLGPWFQTTYNYLLFDRDETISITDWDHWKIAPARPNPFPLEHRQFVNYRLHLEQFLTAASADQGGGDRGGDGGGNNNNESPLHARLECDGNINWDSGFLFISAPRKGKVYEFEWYNRRTNGARIVVSFDRDVTKCVFQYRSALETNYNHAIEMAALDVVSPQWMDLMDNLEVCARPGGREGVMGQDPVAFFWEQDFNKVTCPQTYEKMEYLRNPFKALNTKIRDLTGKPLPQWVIDQKDPTYPLDFSQAPHLDVVYVSSLNFSADFYGTMLAKALRYHAQQGAQVRILIPEATTVHKDKALINHFFSDQPNAKIQYYEYNHAPGTNGDWIDTFHRVIHSKVVIGYSFRNPKDDFVVTGGRNIRDSYLFRDKPIYKRFPWLKNYAAGEEPFIYYDDFEVEMRGAALTKSILAQALSIWNRNIDNQMYRSTNLNLTHVVSAEQVGRLRSLHQLYPLVRHVMSLPYTDGSMLDQFYVQMFDSAQKEILLTTPYFRPTTAISAALDRAAHRGVKIKVLTRIQLAGDGSPAIAEDVNKDGINRHLADLDIYEWTDPDSILHAKLLVIDGELSFISSVNMNQRSFIHDIESGVLILHEATATHMRQEILNYFTKARQVTHEQKIKWFNSMILDVLDNYF